MPSDELEEIDLTGYTFLEIGSSTLLVVGPDGECWYRGSFWPLAEALPEIMGAGGEAGAEGGGLGGITRDFQDNPVGKLMGSSGGNPVSSLTSSIGTGGEVTDPAPIGPIAGAT